MQFFSLLAIPVYLVYSKEGGFALPGQPCPCAKVKEDKQVTWLKKQRSLRRAKRDANGYEDDYYEDYADDANADDKIVGGYEAKQAKPWVARILYPNLKDSFSGGSLINKRYILTAAHCICPSQTANAKVKLKCDKDTGKPMYKVKENIKGG